ncbi:MAG TPA: NADH-quinone oxidoreductase subunit NuoE [Blastocatellia bacterium]|nr:NADH-quinone oxidoreductase subunit NuoE [Blastocatellia bacterium]
MEFSPEAKKQYETILKRYPDKRAALLPVLWLGVREFGYISIEAADYIANLMGLSGSQVYSVASFYTMFPKRKIGKHHIQVCKTLSCWMGGAPKIIDHLKNRLGINVGETTPDGNCTLSTVECLGSCGTAPMMQVDVDYYENLTPQSVDQILERLK